MNAIFFVLAVLIYSITLTFLAFIALLLTILQLLRIFHAQYLEEQKKKEKKEESQSYVAAGWGTVEEEAEVAVAWGVMQEEVVEAAEVEITEEEDWPKIPETTEELRWGLVSDEVTAKLDQAYAKAKELKLYNPATIDERYVYAWHRRQELIFRMRNNIEPLF